MSMNLHVWATKTVIERDTNQEYKMNRKFSLVQTPSDVTRDIMSKPDARVAYCEWIAQRFEQSKAQELLSELQDWIEQCDRDGYKLEWFMM